MQYFIANSALEFVLSWAGAVLFCFFIIYDTQVLSLYSGCAYIFGGRLYSKLTVQMFGLKTTLCWGVMQQVVISQKSAVFIYFTAEPEVTQMFGLFIFRYINSKYRLSCINSLIIIVIVVVVINKYNSNTILPLK